MSSRTQRLLDDGDEPSTYTSWTGSSSAASANDSFLTRVRLNHNKLLTYICIGLILVAVIVIGFIAVAIRRAEGDEENNQPHYDSVDECVIGHSPHSRPVTASARHADDVTPQLLIQNCTLHDGRGNVHEGFDVLMEGGLIKEVGANLPAVAGNTYNVEGRHCTPGLIDMHSHLGVYSWPADLWATQDGNEMTNPIFPQARAIDAFNPTDRALNWTRTGGITTSQILPGSGNAMGGEGLVVKHKVSPYIHDLIVADAPRLLKMACGENPKRVYGSRNITPMSRMGTVWLMRQAFQQARESMEAQRRWCSADEPRGLYPYDLMNEGLIALLMGQARLHNHCYMVHDFQAILRLTEEFGYKVSAFHHSLEAWKIPDMLKNITIATWADWWGFKAEAYDGSVYAPIRLYEAGVPVVIKSDDDVVANYLLWETAKAHHYGLPAEYALSAITYNAAVAMGLEQRMGSIAVGLDADVVVWDDHLMKLGTRPDKVIIDGHVVVDNGVKGSPAAWPRVAANLTCPENSEQETLGCYIITGVNVYTMVDNATEPLRGASVLVQNGNVTCVATGNTCFPPTGCRVYAMSEPATIIPGLIEAGSGIGQFEIGSETATQDGTTDGSGVNDPFSLVHAMDGIHTHSRHVASARKAGVLTAINPPSLGSQIVVGISGAFHTTSATNNNRTALFIDDVLVQHRVSLHLQFGNNAKYNGITDSISGQFAILRAYFSEAQLLLQQAAPLQWTAPLVPFVLALNGSLPVSVTVHGADEIAILLRLQREFGFRLIIHGGAEAHLVASKLAAASPPVAVVFTSRVPPSTFETSRARDDALTILQAAGVQWAIQAASADNARNLRWEGGWQRRYNPSLTTGQIIAGMTVNVKHIFGVSSDAVSATEWAHGVGEVRPMSKANFVLFNGDPLGVESRVQLTALGTDVECRPIQY